MSKTSITRYELWEELIFGDKDLYARVVHNFPDLAELHGSEEDTGDAQGLIRYILQHVRNDILQLLNNRISGPLGADPFHRHLITEIEDLLSEIPQDLVDEVEEGLQDDLEEPQQLPVQWTEEETE